MAPSGHASGKAIFGVVVTFTIIAALSTLLRLYTRLVISRNIGLDDFFIAAAMVFAIMLTISMCIGVKYGMGRHQASLSTHEEVHSLIWFWASVWIYYIALWCAKISILLQYLRIFPQTLFRRITIGVMVAVTAYGLWTVFSAIWACTPISYFWTYVLEENPNARCLNRLSVWFANAGLNIISDVAITVLPLPLIKGLNLPKKSKLALMIVFCLGAVTCIVSLLRLQALYAISVTNDVSWDNPLAAVFSNLEVNIGITCPCLPSMKACINRIYPRFFSSHQTEPSGQSLPPASGHVALPTSHVGSRDEISLEQLKSDTKTIIYEGPKSSWDDVNCTHVQPGQLSAVAELADIENGIHVLTVFEQSSQDRFVRGPSPTGSTTGLVKLRE